MIKKGEAIGQGIFQKYLITDEDNAEGKRSGGFGSTDQRVQFLHFLFSYKLW